MNSQMMNGTGSMMNGYGGASPNQTGTSFMPGANKSMLSLTDVDGEETTATTPMSRKKKGKKRDDDDDDQVAILREDLRMWSTSGTEIGKHILEKMERVERTVRVIEKTTERQTEMMARTKDDNSDKIMAEQAEQRKQIEEIHETQEKMVEMLHDLMQRSMHMQKAVDEQATAVREEVQLALAMRKQAEGQKEALGEDGSDAGNMSGGSGSHDGEKKHHHHHHHHHHKKKSTSSPTREAGEVVATSSRDGVQPRWLSS